MGKIRPSGKSRELSFAYNYPIPDSLPDEMTFSLGYGS